MSQTILLEQDDYHAHLYSLNLQIFTGTDVIYKKTVEEVLEVLRVIPQVSLIVCSGKQEMESCVLDISTYLQLNDLRIPMITFCDPIDKVENTAFMDSKSNLVDVVKKAANILGVVPKDLVEKVVPDFYPISVKNFLYMDTAICDVFIKTSETPMSHEYSKKISSGESFSSSFVLGCIDKEIEHLYVLKNDRVKFVNSFSEQLLRRLDQKDLSLEDRIKTTDRTFDLIKSNMKFVGFNENDYRTAKKTVQSIMTIISMNKSNLKGFVKDLVEMQTSYLFRKVVLTTYFSTTAIRNTNWGLDSHLELLGHVSLFHDLTLETDRQTRIRSTEDVDEFCLTPEEKKHVLEHAFHASKQVTSMDTLFSEVSKIILQHHGSADGIGFPKKCDNNLSPLTFLFMACDIYADTVINWENDITHSEIVDYLRDKNIDKNIWKYIEILRP